MKATWFARFSQDCKKSCCEFLRDKRETFLFFAILQVHKYLALHVVCFFVFVFYCLTFRLCSCLPVFRYILAVRMFSNDSFCVFVPSLWKACVVTGSFFFLRKIVFRNKYYNTVCIDCILDCLVTSWACFTKFVRGRIKASSDWGKHQRWTEGPIKLPSSRKQDFDHWR